MVFPARWDWEWSECEDDLFGAPPSGVLIIAIWCLRIGLTDPYHLPRTQFRPKRKKAGKSIKLRVKVKQDEVLTALTMAADLGKTNLFHWYVYTFLCSNKEKKIKKCRFPRCNRPCKDRIGIKSSPEARPREQRFARRVTHAQCFRPWSS